MQIPTFSPTPRPRLFSILTLLILVSGPALFRPAGSPAWAAEETFSGKVVAVTDGDTLGVLREGREVKIRLHGIDAPESAQAFGSAAKQFASEHVFGKTVTVRVMDMDRYGRLVGVVTAGTGTSLNEELVRGGMAWWYHQYGAQERKLAEAEIEARSARRGLWKDSYPVPPWAFRHPETATDRATRSAPEVKPVPPREGNGAVGAAKVTLVYVTRTGAKYHREGCRFARTATAVTLKDATARGLAPCAVCHP